MTLTEALMRRSRLKGRVEALKTRLLNYAQVQEGDTPPEPPEELLAKLRQSLSDLEELTKRINRTNAKIEARPGLTLNDLLIERDFTARRVRQLNELADRAGGVEYRVSRYEVRHAPAVDVVALRAEAEELSEHYVDLDTLLQKTNWQAKLVT